MENTIKSYQQQLTQFLTKNGFSTICRESFIDVTSLNNNKFLLEITTSGLKTEPQVVVCGWGKFKTQNYSIKVKNWKENVLNRIKLFISENTVKIPKLTK